MSRLTGAAIILRTRPYGESDLIVDLFTEQRGRTTAVARGALRSKRRYMGILELGQIVKVDYVIKPGLATLGPCDLIQGVRRVRDELKALQQLYYILELCLNCTPLEERDEALFQSIVELISAIESEPGVEDLALIAWELSLLTHLGYHLKIDRCPITGAAPDALSFEVGGAVSSRSGCRHWPVKTDSLRILYRLQRGAALNEAMIQVLSVEELQELRTAFIGLWGEITGKQMKTDRIFKQLSTPSTFRSIAEIAPSDATQQRRFESALQPISFSLLLLVSLLISCQGLNDRVPSTAIFEVKGSRQHIESSSAPTTPTASRKKSHLQVEYVLSSPQKENEQDQSSLKAQRDFYCKLTKPRIAEMISAHTSDHGLKIISAQSKMWIETELPLPANDDTFRHEDLGLPNYHPNLDKGGLWVLYTAHNGQHQSLILTKPIPWLSDRAKVIGHCEGLEVITLLSFAELNTKRLIEPSRQLKLVSRSSYVHSAQ